MRAAIARWRRT